MKTFGRSSTHYALTNHLGNVLAVISDAPGGGTQPTVESLTDYYPFGMAMPGRSYQSSKYRYGFNGKEIDKENEVVDFGERLYDYRLCRWRKIDQFTNQYPNWNPYTFTLNSPLRFIDSNGNFVEDQSGNIIFTVDTENPALPCLIPSAYEGYYLGFQGKFGRILTDKGTEINAFIAMDNQVNIYKIDVVDNQLTYTKVGPVEKYREFADLEFDNNYNCTGNALAKKSLTISSLDITPKILQEEGYKILKEGEDHNQGDIVIYFNSIKEGIQHFELFETNNMVSTKGGLQPVDKELSKPGENELYKDMKRKYLRRIASPTQIDLTDYKTEKVPNKQVTIVKTRDFEKIKNEVQGNTGH